MFLSFICSGSSEDAFWDILVRESKENEVQEFKFEDAQELACFFVVYQNI